MRRDTCQQKPYGAKITEKHKMKWSQYDLFTGVMIVLNSSIYWIIDVSTQNVLTMVCKQSQTKRETLLLSCTFKTQSSNLPSFITQRFDSRILVSQ